MIHYRSENGFLKSTLVNEVSLEFFAVFDAICGGYRVILFKGNMNARKNHEKITFFRSKYKKMW